MACAIEDAGFEIRDQIMWVYGSGFPKSHNIGKAVDKKLGNEREEYIREDFAKRSNKTKQRNSQVPCGEKGRYTKGTSQWEGYGTALKPAHEPIVLARKPLSEKTIAKNVLKWGTGGLNIDKCRVEHNEDLSVKRDGHKLDTNKQGWGFKAVDRDNKGRFPANFIHDGSQEVMDLFPNKAHRFFYCPKASKKERNMGCEGLEEGEVKRQGLCGEHKNPKHKNNHPTVKPIKLMQYLCRLTTPKNGTVLDPFTGSGTTGIAAKREGFNFIGIEKEEEYIKIARARIDGQV
jgi:site-specific DNA-methyltransferase (adenine-specific)